MLAIREFGYGKCPDHSHKNTLFLWDLVYTIVIRTSININITMSKNETLSLSIFFAVTPTFSVINSYNIFWCKLWCHLKCAHFEWIFHLEYSLAVFKASFAIYGSVDENQRKVTHKKSAMTTVHYQVSNENGNIRKLYHFNRWNKNQLSFQWFIYKSTFCRAQNSAEIAWNTWTGTIIFHLWCKYCAHYVAEFF